MTNLIIAATMDKTNRFVGIASIFTMEVDATPIPNTTTTTPNKPQRTTKPFKFLDILYENPVGYPSISIRNEAWFNPDSIS